jgi:hypothetical protein
MRNLWRFQLPPPPAQPVATDDPTGTGTITRFHAARSGTTSLASDVSRISPSPGANRRRLP